MRGWLGTWPRLAPPSPKLGRASWLIVLLHSPACERNQEAILELLSQWLPPGARVLEIGSGSGQHAIFFARTLAGLQWQPSDRRETLQDLAERVALEGRDGLAPGARVADPLELDVDQADHWPQRHFDAVFSANSCHIMALASVANLIAGASRGLAPGGLLVLYGPFQDGGIHTAASNAAFDAHLRSLNPAMGLRDAEQIKRWAREQGLSARADQPMPAQNRTLVFQRD